ncbi:MAG: DUF4251 domain-containing protein [Candidatus Cyclobacteriaceae bacterium M3_2C_046]
MKKYLIIIVLLSFGFSVQAQEKMSRAERKEQRRIERAEASAKMKKMLEKQKFVLEANNLFDRYGQIYNVAPNLNFIAVSGDNAVIQIGSNSGIGNNGVGGITVDGRVTKFELDKNEKKGRYVARINIMSNVGNYDVLLNVGATASASAQITSNNPTRLRYAGTLVPLDESEIFVGRSVF